MNAQIEIFIISKEGTVLHKYNLLAMDETAQDQLVGGFLTALNNFAKEVGFPKGVSLIRSGNIEARFSSGEYVFSVLIIDYDRPLGLATEKILSGLAQEITETFEKDFLAVLKKGKKNHIYRGSDFLTFRNKISTIIDNFGKETMELYQKLILVEAMYAKVPQKWILPLLEEIRENPDIFDKIREIPKYYHSQLQDAINKVNYESKPVWDLFAIPYFEL